jgi:hypothetical protein
LSSLFVLPILPLMPKAASPRSRDFITLSDMPQAVLGITCDLCQRREQFDVEALKREHGSGVKMPELLSRLVADCPRQSPRSRRRRVYERGTAGSEAEEEKLGHRQIRISLLCWGGLTDE